MNKMESLAPPHTYTPDIINVLRVTATLLVFFLHGRSYVKGIADSTNPLLFLTCTPAWAGVWIFAFISSYLLGSGFITRRYILSDVQGGPAQYQKIFHFYAKRFIRLAPIYYLYCFAFEFFTDSVYFWRHPFITLRILTFTFNGNGGISGVGHLWYLSLAMQIYLIIPFVYLLFGKIRKKSFHILCFCITLVAGLAVRLVLNHYNASWYTWVYTFIGANLDLVICGVLLAFIKFQDGYRTNRKRGYTFFLDIQFVLLLLYNCYIYYHSGASENLFIYRYILPTSYIASCSLLILRHHDPNKRVQAVAVRDWKYYILHFVDWFTPYTFSFYVLHIRMFSYFSLTFGTLAMYVNARLWARYIFFFYVSFVLTLCGAVILKYAVDGITSHINKAISNYGGKV